MIIFLYILYFKLLSSFLLFFSFFPPFILSLCIGSSLHCIIFELFCNPRILVNFNNINYFFHKTLISYISKECYWLLLCTKTNFVFICKLISLFFICLHIYDICNSSSEPHAISCQFPHSLMKSFTGICFIFV